MWLVTPLLHLLESFVCSVITVIVIQIIMTIRQFIRCRNMAKVTTRAPFKVIVISNKQICLEMLFKVCKCRC